MVAIKNILFIAACASAAAVEKRNVKSVLASLSVVNSDILSLGSQTTSWDGSTGGAIPIESAESDLDDDIQSATSQAQKESQFSSTDSNSVLSYVTGTILPNISSVLSVFSTKSSSLSKAGLKQTVHDDLQSLQTDSAALSNALIKIASSDTKAAATAASSTLNSYLSKAIVVFS